ncbi:MAG: TadE/TadG family type IV pilus assembly protein [Aeromicrobium erythreum]
MRARRRAESGASVVEFVLVMTVLVPLVLGIVQVGLVLHVRNTLTAAASDGARAGAPLGATPEQAAERTRSSIRAALDDRYAGDVTATATQVGDVEVVAVRVRTEVPALGLMGPAVPLDVRGRAVREQDP